MTQEQKDILVGSILGDGSIYKHNCDSVRSCRFTEAHSEEQREYVEWKYEKLRDFIHNPMRTRYEGGKEIKISGKKCKIKQQYLFETVFHEEFYKLRKTFYPNGEKIIPKNIYVSPLALAVFYMDDGSYNGHSCCFHTQSYDDVSLNNFVDFMKLQYSLDLKISDARAKLYQSNGKMLYLNNQNSRRFIKIIEPYILQIFKYKIGQ